MTDYWDELSKPATQGGKQDGEIDYADAIFNTTTTSRTQGLGRDYVTSKPFATDPAGVGTSFLSGMIESPEAKIDYFAQQRFPNIPLAESRKRYGIHNGDIVFVDDEGRVQQEVAGAAGNTAAIIGEQGLPIGGAIVGTMTGGPAGGALGGAGGLGYRKVIAQGLLGDDQSASGNAADIAIEGALNYGGAKIGEGIARHVVNRRVARDVVRFDPQATQQLMDKAKQMGIEITPAEASGLASLVSQQTRYGKGFDDAGDILNEFYKRRAGQEAAAVDDFIGATPSGAKAGAEVRNVASTTISEAKAARQAAAIPLYQQHVDNYVLPDDIAVQFMDDPLLMAQAKKVIADPVYGFTGGGDEAYKSLRFWDTVKKSLDDLATEAYQSGRAYQAGRYGNASRKITGTVDGVNPGYAEARAAHAGLSPEVNAYVEGLEGVLAKTKDPSLPRAARSLFESAEIEPGDVRRVRAQFISQGKDAEWDQTLNYWLRHKWETIAKGKGDPDSINVAGDWRKRVFGSARQRKVMEAAMGPKRFAAFNDLMEVLEATSRVPKGQSMTQPAMEAARLDAQNAAPIASLAKGFGVGGLRDWWIGMKSDQWRTAIARTITNQESLDTLGRLRKLRSMNPTNEKAVSAVTLALTQAGVYGGNRALQPQIFREPPALNQSAPQAQP